MKTKQQAHRKSKERCIIESKRAKELLLIEKIKSYLWDVTRTVTLL
jgi:hypothetical protein